MDDIGRPHHTGGVTPYITILDGRAAEAIAFYERAFGAKERIRMLADDVHRIVHAHLSVNGGSLMLHDEFPEYATAPVPTLTVSGKMALHLQVDDADAWWERALHAGADIRLPIADQFWGDRYGQLSDPFGYVWSIGSPATKH